MIAARRPPTQSHQDGTHRSRPLRALLRHDQVGQHASPMDLPRLPLRPLLVHLGMPVLPLPHVPELHGGGLVKSGAPCPVGAWRGVGRSGCVCKGWIGSMGAQEGCFLGVADAQVSYIITITAASTVGYPPASVSDGCVAYN